MKTRRQAVLAVSAVPAASSDAASGGSQTGRSSHDKPMKVSQARPQASKAGSGHFMGNATPGECTMDSSKNDS